MSQLPVTRAPGDLNAQRVLWALAQVYIIMDRCTHIHINKSKNKSLPLNLWDKCLGGVGVGEETEKEHSKCYLGHDLRPLPAADSAPQCVFYNVIVKTLSEGL